MIITIIILLHVSRESAFLIGSLANDDGDGDGNENHKKQ